MISYDPFWTTMRREKISTYDLIHKYHISANTIYRMKHGEVITTKTLDELCCILRCPVSDILSFCPPDREDEK